MKLAKFLFKSTYQRAGLWNSIVNLILPLIASLLAVILPRFVR